MTTYPGTIQSITDYAGTVTLANADHASWHATTSDTVEALETVVGTTAGTSIAKNFASGDFAARINSTNVLQQALSGTLNSSVLGTPAITGGTATSSVLNNNTVGTPAITGGTATSSVLNNVTIGTPAVTGGTLTSPNIYFNNSITVADDGVGTLTPPAARGLIIVSGITNAGYSGIFAYRAATTPWVEKVAAVGTAIAGTTGQPAGTTNPDGNVYISSHTDGKVYIENRIGDSRFFWYIFLGGA